MESREPSGSQSHDSSLPETGPSGSSSNRDILRNVLQGAYSLFKSSEESYNEGYKAGQKEAFEDILKFLSCQAHPSLKSVPTHDLYQYLLNNIDSSSRPALTSQSPPEESIDLRRRYFPTPSAFSKHPSSDEEMGPRAGEGDDHTVSLKRPAQKRVKRF